ncbi:MAG: YceI family protein [Pseudomonadota bacterium]
MSKQNFGGRLASGILAGCAGLIVLSGASHAEEKIWTVEPDHSSIAFGSIKNDAIGESHHFSGISGTVGSDGQVKIDIDLTSVETNIDIRNERMLEFVFGDSATATLNAEVDMDDVSALEVGDSTVTDAFGTLSLLGADVDVDAPLFVTRLSEDRVLVTTDGMAMLNIADAELTGGIDKLQEIAELDSITRVSPVTLRLFLTATDDGES